MQSCPSLEDSGLGSGEGTLSLLHTEWLETARACLSGAPRPELSFGDPLASHPEGSVLEVCPELRSAEDSHGRTHRPTSSTLLLSAQLAPK